MTRARGVLRGLLTAREMGLVLAIALVVAGIALLGDREAFFSQANRIILLRQIGLVGVLAVGEAVVIIAGGIDLSVGSVIAFSGMLCALTLQKVAGGHNTTSPLPLASLALGLGVGLLLGLAVGLLHALLVTRLQLPPFIATLGTLAGLRSAAELITSSQPIPCAFSNYRALSEGLTPLWVFVAVALAIGTLLRTSRAGRQIRALGGNEDAARLSGLRIDRLKCLAYCLSGLLAGLSGLLYSSYNGQGDPRLGVAYELQAIAAVVVGGCSLTGGVGSVAGVVLGVILLQVTLNGIFLVVRGNSTQWSGLVVGVVVILAVALNNARQRRIERAAERQPSSVA